MEPIRIEILIFIMLVSIKTHTKFENSRQHNEQLLSFFTSGPGASNNPCSGIYAGPKPFSEPEIRSLSEFVKTIENLKIYISFHSYSQLLLFPYVGFCFFFIGYVFDFNQNFDFIIFGNYIFRVLLMIMHLITMIWRVN